MKREWGRAWLCGDDDVDISKLARAINQGYNQDDLVDFDREDEDMDNKNNPNNGNSLYLNNANRNIMLNDGRSNDNEEDYDDDGGHSELEDSDDEEDGQAWNNLHKTTTKANISHIMHTPAAPSGKLV
eukprot:GDKH01026248.1.p1 GENE.GDKH01026248.1~~GDKH01026248.1.p1  ORF type:complete len:128 (-),score=21.25 GDKH01026248.1:144-527(-)